MLPVGFSPSILTKMRAQPCGTTLRSSTIEVPPMASRTLRESFMARLEPGSVPFAIGKNAIFSIILAMRVDVLVLDGVFDLGLAAVLDVFQTANELSAVSGRAAPRFEVRCVSVRKKVKTAQGFSVPVTSVSAAAPDCVVVPAIGYKMP